MKLKNQELNDFNNIIVCEWCKKSFKRETTLLTHMCEPFRRWNSKDAPASRIGYSAWKAMLEVLSNKKNLDYHEYINSRHYSSFARFGEWCVNEQVQEPEKYIQWHIKNKHPLKKWTDRLLYNAYLVALLTSETPESGLNRSLKYIEKWSLETGERWNDFFGKVNVNIAINWISQGKISPWILYTCDSGIRFLENCNEEQLAIIQKTAPIKNWKIKILRCKSDCDNIKSVLKEAGM